MRTMDHARAKAREVRALLGGQPAGLRERVTRHMLDEYRIELVPMSPDQLNESRGQLDTESGILKYDRTLAEPELLLLLAHELGHLVLHKRLSDSNVGADPVLASAYGDAGPGAVARYSPRTYEEAQASAFALELVCPAEEVWHAWREEDSATFETLAGMFRCTSNVVRVQLSHALHGVALGGPKPPPAVRAIPFTERQRYAARVIGRPVIVDAGPGTGKTATVVERLRFLIQEHGANAAQILALTFSNEAAQEMGERVAAAFGADVADAMTIRTFHGFGMEFLHAHGHLSGHTEDFRLLDEDAQVELVNALLGQVPCEKLFRPSDPAATAQRLVEHINYCKHRLITTEVLAREVARWPGETATGLGTAAIEDAANGKTRKKTERQLEKERKQRDRKEREAREAQEAAEQFVGVFRAYEEAKARAQRIDFADLIAIPIGILAAHAEVRDMYAEKFPWVIVDEFQDVTRATSALLKALCGAANPPWVVGDARQSIYQFLGAAPENVVEFTRDFPGAEVIELEVNFRSSPPIVTAANQLATLLEKPDAASGDLRERWTPGADIEPLGAEPVSIAAAASDAAEAQGVADRVSAWIRDEGVAPSDIAVLARRHIDVRNVILELRRRDIIAQASGLLTADGAAGDLAVVLTFADAPKMSIPRVAFALGRGRYATGAINATIAELLRQLRPGEGADADTDRPAQYSADLADEIVATYSAAVASRHATDGFTAMCNFLFVESRYLRRILDGPDNAERAMTLVEIVSSLSLAANYRSMHPGTGPGASRVGFAERFRERLTRTLPIPLAPRPRADAVHVMTCHASKGLEFPCVVVVGQTMPPQQEDYEWLASALRPTRKREEDQANALLFVAVTRAKRAVVVSYPERATAGVGSGKTIVSLLGSWRSECGVPTQSWIAEAAPAVSVAAGNLWSAPMPDELKASVLDDSVCPLMTYLEVFLGARFPEEERKLYPIFFGFVRRCLRAIASRANASGAAVSDAEAMAILEAQWPADRYADHDHFPVYRRAAERMVVGFARAFTPAPGANVDLDPEIRLLTPGGPDIRVDLVAHFRQADGSVVAITFRPESLAEVEDRHEPLVWSALTEPKRISLVLLEDAAPGIRPKVYSGTDALLYDYQWSKKPESLPKQVAELKAQRDAFARGDFSSDMSKFKCERCRVRASCPHWIGALETD